MSNIKKYRIELMLILGYVLADNLHMIFRELSYSPGWYTPFLEGYKFHNSVFFTFHYFSQAPLLMTFVLLIESPRELNKIWLRLALFIVSLRDFTGELFELMNIHIPYFSNSGYNTSCYIKNLYLLFAIIIAFYMKKRCMKILDYFSYP